MISEDKDSGGQQSIIYNFRSYSLIKRRIFPIWHSFYSYSPEVKCENTTKNITEIEKLPDWFILF